MADLLHDSSARVVIFVDSMPESHQAKGVTLIFGLREELRYSFDGADLIEHTQDGLIGTTMRRPPKSR